MQMWGTPFGQKELCYLWQAVRNESHLIRRKAKNRVDNPPYGASWASENL